MQLIKKLFLKKKTKNKDCIHWEGKYFCDCRVRNFRKWLGVKLYGQPERLSPEDHIVGDRKVICDSLNSMET